ncbi:B1 bradykinin receptor-like [Physella acuta]|uniref:B1 bradykinin receptor-like n=1 Tax=Physella acuta TaxID=109671 RepID=UPI0027DE8AF8|nr:B1 bradykinin receptor-like [Physella acuta]
MISIYFNKTGYHSNEDTGNQLLSEDIRAVIEIVNYVFICTIFSLFGIVSNNINIVVFYKQGLNSSINISFLALAVSDLCSLVTLLWFNIRANPYIVNSDLPIVASEFVHLTGGFPHACFARITCLITTYVTAERCLCITLPLTVKRLITPRRTTVIIFFIYALPLTSLAPEYLSMYIDWKFYPDKNISLLGLVPTTNYDKLSGLTFLLYAAYILVSFSALIIFTITLIITLRRKTKWRKVSIHEIKQSDTLSTRDQKTVTMVIVIAIVLLVCYTPSVVINIAVYTAPGFNVVGKYSNIFFVTWSFGFAMDAFNSSVSMVLYYKMSSKYRTTLHELFAGCKPNNGKQVA